MGAYMKNRIKSIVSLTSGAVLLCVGLCPTAQAQSVLIEYGSAYLANTLGQTSGPEVITVSYFVVENLNTSLYTYDYTVNNPVGDILLNNDGSPKLSNPNNPNSTTPETMDYFSLSFDATIPGSVVNPTVPVVNGNNGYFQNNGANGLAWLFPAVSPGNSVLIGFQSYLAPGPGNASASDSNPPSPWASNPYGQQVPVPRAAPEPMTMALFGLAFLLLPFRSNLRRRVL